MKKIIHSILICTCISLTSNSQAHKVIGISDGDTMTLLVDNKPLKIRLANIDAPEKKQAYGQKSKESLSEICWETDATYQAQTVDRYGRTVAVVFCNGKEVNREQVARGFAWVYTQYNKDQSLPYLEKIAQTNKRGLWADKDAQAPWDFRKNKQSQF
jgi:micrococcal nuclease